MIDLQILRELGPASLKQYLGDNTSPPVHMSPREWNDFMDENAGIILKQERRVISAADLPYPQMASALRAVSSEVDTDTNHRHLLPMVILPIYSRLAESQADNSAMAEVTRAAAALLAWKGRHGSFPPTLATAITPSPLDPYNGKALQYRREGQGFVVYSVGRKGTDTGGAPTAKPNPYAILFRYPFPSYFAGPLKEN